MDIAANNTNYRPNGTLRKQLNHSAWIDRCRIQNIDDLIRMDEMMDIIPPERGKVMMFGKIMDVPRYQKSYGRDYTFSGVNHTADPIPDTLATLHEYIDNLGYGPFNQVMVNWYPTGESYIGAHSDDEGQLMTDASGHTVIASVSLGATRTFRISSKMSSGHTDIDLQHGDIVIMGGTMQTDFKHEILKINGKKGRDMGCRINITFRQFKDLVEKIQ